MDENTNRPARHFYSRYCRHGINVSWGNRDGSINPFPGTILRFTTRAARDAWIDDDVWNGNFCRGAMSGRDVHGVVRKFAKNLDNPQHFWDVPYDDDVDGHKYETLGGGEL